MIKYMGYPFYFALFSFLLLGTLSIHYPAQAHSLASQFFTQDILSVVSYLAGISFGIKAAVTFQKHNLFPKKVPLAQPIVLGLVSSLLLAMPTFMSTASSCTLGSPSTVHGVTNYSIK